MVEEGRIYRGTVRGIKPFGAFISLDDEPVVQVGRRRRKPEGMCHISEITDDRRLESPNEELRMGQNVYVKVIQMHDNGKISLSMRSVDQLSGKDMNEVREHVSKRKKSRRVDDWELNQMSHAYGMKRQKVSEIDEDEDPFAEVDSGDESDRSGGGPGDEEVNIEVSSKVPTFLAGETESLKGSTSYEPAKAARLPEGSLEKIAKGGSKFLANAREARVKTKRQEEKREEEKDQNSATAADAQVDRAIEEWRRQTKTQSYGIKTDKTIDQVRKSLPVYEVRSQLLEQVKTHDMLVVVGETGSGKSTQITQYLDESGYSKGGIIGCTQPRRVAAVSVAKRVSEEVGCKVGNEVGYTIRFEDCTSRKTRIKYMTDGMLEREAIVDPEMKRYSVIMLDEAHERTVATDVLFALLREAVRKRKGSLKLIVTSATLDSDKFSKYFDRCPIFHIKGRSYPVKTYYTKEPERDYIEATIDTVVDVHVNNPPGDILVFLTGREEIETCCETLVQRMTNIYKQNPRMSELVVLPIYSAMPSEMQSRIFEPAAPGKRKVVVATNIAETSITIDGIYYVVDPGFVKVNAYDSKLGMDSLIVQPISRAQADQRSGRAGRTGPGICYRLYTKLAYQNEMAANTVPEIQRQNLSNTILMLKAMGISDVLNFGFMDPPARESILRALEELYILDALDEDGEITRVGRRMSYFPMEPLLSKTLIQSVSFGCSEEVITIISMLSVPDVFYRPKDQRDKADRAKQHFHDFNGDHLTLLNVYQKWQQSNYSKTWCQDHFIHDKSMKKARDVQKQLTTLLTRNNADSLVSCRGDWDKIRKAFVSGYFKNCARRSHNPNLDDEGTFRTLSEDTPVHVHPSSALFRKSGFEYVLYHTLILTNKEYMHCITKIDPKWLVQYAPKFYREASPGELTASRRKEKIKPLFNKYDRNESWRLSNGRR